MAGGNSLLWCMMYQNKTNIGVWFPAFLQLNPVWTIKVISLYSRTLYLPSAISHLSHFCQAHCTPPRTDFPHHSTISETSPNTDRNFWEKSFYVSPLEICWVKSVCTLAHERHPLFPLVTRLLEAWVVLCITPDGRHWASLTHMGLGTLILSRSNP